MENKLLKSFLLLSLCSVVSALLCYECNSDNDAECSPKDCSSQEDACLNVTVRPTNQLFRRCWTDLRCHIRAVQAEFSKGADISFVCCNWDLCNSKTGGTPRTDANSFRLGILAAFVGLHHFLF
ncbi:CD59A glycoprotein-like isoform X2 [Carcharodon carcharias]|uniref:CD59A glycoprotein-like isoform X2 n=1 Tax=Carcharodon carcharias TaxID=13397 RepID=UPI001B7EDB74|nr:CD59A glycoprotein-like isoform X2 [Carcharodon carcharias]